MSKIEKARALGIAIFILCAILIQPASVSAASGWQGLADKWSKYYNIDTRVVKATVEAETNGMNIPGDQDKNRVYHAFGYGQVWPKWHYDDIQKALYDAPPGLCTGSRDEQYLGNALLKNNEASMATATLVVKEYWLRSGQSNDFSYAHYVAFSKLYVGPDIPSNDLSRRWAIWKKYFP